MAETILVINAGSSSIKLSTYEIGSGGDLRLAAKAQMDGIPGHPRLRATDARHVVVTDEKFRDDEVPTLAAAMQRAGAWLSKYLEGEEPAAIGHRVVHGGPSYASPVVIDDAVLSALEALIPLAPLHQPHNLAPIGVLKTQFPGVLQVACFDTAFHRAHGELADRYALPESFYREGVRHYGFHGLSYEYIARTLQRVAPEIADRSVVVAHLGSGASMCAMRGGHSVDSTMGFTALDGLPMGTRCGQLDPGVVLYLLATKRYGVADVEHLLYHQAGLLGLSGVSNDVRDLLASSAPGARLALDYFVYRVAREIGSLAGALGGLDALVFTAGIGENSAEMRARICSRAQWLGIRIDDSANHRGDARISLADSRVAVWVIPTDEERMIAEHTLNVFRSRKEES